MISKENFEGMRDTNQPGYYWVMIETEEGTRLELKMIPESDFDKYECLASKRKISEHNKILYVRPI